MVHACSVFRGSGCVDVRPENGRLNLLPPSFRRSAVILATAGMATIFNGFGARDCETALLLRSGDKIRRESSGHEENGALDDRIYLQLQQYVISAPQV